VKIFSQFDNVIEFCYSRRRGFVHKSSQTVLGIFRLQWGHGEVRMFVRIRISWLSVCYRHRLVQTCTALCLSLFNV